MIEVEGRRMMRLARELPPEQFGVLRRPKPVGTAFQMWAYACTPELE
jgi:hypothetical protein